MAETVKYLSEDIVYHNLPWDPVTGHGAVRKVLDPSADGPDCALKKMDIQECAATGNIVMNALRELWERGGVSVLLPVAGGVYTTRRLDQSLG
jgi:limonene-1,2-epoxide hydrolase